MPVAEQAFGACTGGWDYGSAWNGIDGWGSPDVLQAGVEFDAYCALGGHVKSTYYSAWYEWYPFGEVRIGGFPIAPGDDIFVEVWNTSSTAGHAYLVNYNNNQSVNIAFNAPAGTSWSATRPSGLWSVPASAAAWPPSPTTSWIPSGMPMPTPRAMPRSMTSTRPTRWTCSTTHGNVISYPEYLGPGVVRDAR